MNQNSLGQMGLRWCPSFFQCTMWTPVDHTDRGARGHRQVLGLTEPNPVSEPRVLLGLTGSTSNRSQRAVVSEGVRGSTVRGWSVNHCWTLFRETIARTSVFVRPSPLSAASKKKRPSAAWSMAVKTSAFNSFSRRLTVGCVRMDGSAMT